MKNFKIRKKILAILISGNMLLTGCSIKGNITSKKEESKSEFSYIHNSTLNPFKEETSIEESSQVESSMEETSIEESSQIESSMEETSIEESSQIESSMEETSIEESSQVESSVEETNIEESEVSQESYNEVYTDDLNYIRATYDVNIRTEPNTNSEVLLLLYKGNTLKKLGYIGNWYIVDYKGNKAYVSADYSEEIEQEDLIVDLNESNICYFPYGASLYEDAELTNKKIDIPSLESATIINQEGDSFYIDTNDTTGYVSINSAYIIPQPVVIVDKSEQTLRLYKNNKKQMEFSVVTGNEDPNFYHPTGEGLFDIYSKSYNAELVGPEVNGIPEWDVVVNVFMGFNGGEGIHDATWRSYFGGDIYTYDGSHGCINCPYDEVITLASEVEVGDKVLVKR